MSSNRELSSARRELLAALNTSDRPLSPVGLARALGRDREAVKKLLYSCVRDGQATSTDGGYTTTEPYKHVTSVAPAEVELVHEESIPDTSFPHSGTDGLADSSGGDSPATDTGTEREPVGAEGLEEGSEASPEREDAGVPIGVSTATEVGESGVDKPNLVSPPMGLYCHEPPDGYPRGTYRAQIDEGGRIVPYYEGGLLPDLTTRETRGRSPL
jgi:hypothetical protein